MVKKLCLLLLSLTFFNILGASTLDNLSRELDEIEYEFWSITTQERMGERFRKFSRKLALFTISCRTIQSKLQNDPRNFGMPNLTTYSVAIQDILAEIRKKDIEEYGILIHPRYTSVKEFLNNNSGSNTSSSNSSYSRNYNNRFKNRFNNRHNNRYYQRNNSYNRSSNSSSGTSNNTSNSNKVDLFAYKTFLNQVKQENEEDFLRPERRKRYRTSRRRKNGSRVRSIIDFYNIYMTNLINLRYSIEVIKQKGKDIDKL